MSRIKRSAIGRIGGCTLAATALLSLPFASAASASDSSNALPANDLNLTVTDTAPQHHTITAGNGSGYWQVAADGAVFSFGDAQFAGSAHGITDSAIVGIAKTETGKGYWLVAENGAVFAFGDAGFYGSAHDLNLNAPITGIQRSALGNGY